MTLSSPLQKTRDLYRCLQQGCLVKVIREVPETCRCLIKDGLETCTEVHVGTWFVYMLHMHIHGQFHSYQFTNCNPFRGFSVASQIFRQPHGAPAKIWVHVDIIAVTGYVCWGKRGNMLVMDTNRGSNFDQVHFRLNLDNCSAQCTPRTPFSLYTKIYKCEYCSLLPTCW